jgi:hypothetical protein
MIGSSVFVICNFHRLILSRRHPVRAAFSCLRDSTKSPLPLDNKRNSLAKEIAPFCKGRLMCACGSVLMLLVRFLRASTVGI